MNIDPDASIARLRRVAIGSVAVFLLGGAFFGVSYFLGVLAGGLVALANFDIIERLGRRLTGDRPTTVSWLGVFGLLLRYILLCIALFVIIGVWHANVAAVALGVSAPVAAIFVECGLYAYRESTAERKTQRQRSR